jgi:type I restriction-modification system DNA methylase subunit
LIAKRAAKNNDTAANLGFEAKLWAAADALRNNMDAAESSYTTWRLAKMNLAIRAIDAQIAHGDTFHNDSYPDLKADYVLANPPFNDSDWRGELLKNGKRWVYGVPPAGNANYAWVQHFIHHLAPTGLAGFVLANGSISSNQSDEGEKIGKAIIEADLVDCMVALPGQLFYSTQIPSASGSSLGTRRMADSATGAVTRTQASMPTCQASASAPRWTTSASTATCSRPAANLKELGYGG